jgi:hypothetical protein
MRYFVRPDGRYYAIQDPAPDLLGDLVIQTCHGSRHNRLGGVYTYLEGSISVEDIVKIRLSHGYTEVQQSGERSAR